MTPGYLHMRGRYRATVTLAPDDVRMCPHQHRKARGALACARATIRILVLEQRSPHP